MVELGIELNEVIFLNILFVCSYVGYVEEGKVYFSLMIRDYGIKFKFEYFVCVVDLFSRVGDFDGVYDIIRLLSFYVDVSIWNVFFNGCRIYGRMDIIRSIEGDISNLGVIDFGYYKLLFSLYVEVENWDNFGRVRFLINYMGLRKVFGYIVIEDDR